MQLDEDGIKTQLELLNFAAFFPLHILNKADCEFEKKFQDEKYYLYCTEKTEAKKKCQRCTQADNQIDVVEKNFPFDDGFW